LEIGDWLLGVFLLCKIHFTISLISTGNISIHGYSPLLDFYFEKVYFI